MQSHALSRAPIRGVICHDSPKRSLHQPHCSASDTLDKRVQ